MRRVLDCHWPIDGKNACAATNSTMAVTRAIGVPDDMISFVSSNESKQTDLCDTREEWMPARWWCRRQASDASPWFHCCHESFLCTYLRINGTDSLQWRTCAADKLHFSFTALPSAHQLTSLVILWSTSSIHVLFIVPCNLLTATWCQL
jgi:hypothetical protein